VLLKALLVEDMSKINPKWNLGAVAFFPGVHFRNGVLTKGYWTKGHQAAFSPEFFIQINVTQVAR